ncbi:alkaline phosphatase family protein [Microlunatus panaciterrae]|uniref:YVTN family beta-propeller protein n=1 Tax=Microlunatus panaciterrae TaxID=400768 RepID=A0ABS2RKS8_9ACTN|nr:alkaline phosphatase family protein [Microlunatus panaciterrae]MBM7799328.1 YVTN family beta-propeller protein [Microlunatus panaciterrae]
MKKKLSRSLLAVTAIGVAATASLSMVVGATADSNAPLGTNLVGRQADGSVLVPEGKYVKPLGTTIEQSGQVMDLAIRPDGRTAVDLTKSGKGLFTVVDLVNNTVLQQYTPPKGTGSGNVAVGGLLYSADGTQLWAAQAKNLLRFDVAADGTLSNPVVVKLPDSAPGGVPKGPDGSLAQPLPSGLAWAPDQKTIIASLSGYDTVVGIDSTSGATSWQTAVGIAPRDVVVVGNRVLVSNEGGRRTKSSDFTNYSYNSRVVADRRDGRADSGTVSELDLSSHAVVRTYDVGLDPSALMVRGSDVLVTNSSDDTVSVLNTATGEVARTFNVNPIPGQPYGSSPNALAMIDDDHLAVSLGRNNALAIYELAGTRSTPAFAGLVPTAWYPGKIIVDRQLGKIVVGNLKGVGALGDPRTIAEGPGTEPATGRQVYSDVGVVQLLDPPKAEDMASLTSQVFSNNQWHNLEARNEKAGTTKARPVPVPERIGDPSPIKHVFLIVRENRTYDQVLGDDPRGNGDPTLTQFGRKITPNTHALAGEFPLIDNLYSDGTNSATGHTWLDAGFVNDYLERSYANYVRNYGQPDAMVYPRSGFLWDNALAHRLKARVWGEYAEWFTGADGSAATGSWSDWYRDSQILEGKRTGQPHVPLGTFTTKTDVPSLASILDRDYPNFNTKIPDQYRADLFLNDFDEMTKKDSLPNLNMLWLSSNHTNGSSPGYPTPAAMQADSDLAVGRIVDKISHSKYWKSSAIFVIEDDSQNGVDHVDGHRNVPLVISPYARRGAVVHTSYTQVNVTRTIEQILGLPPMNQVDLAAQPMYDVFTTRRNLTPYTKLDNTVPLDTMNPTLAQADSTMQKTWIAWSEQQDFTKVDQLAFEPFNRLTWYTSNHFTKPYPGDAKVMTPQEVLAKFPQAAVSHDPDGKLPETKALRPHSAGSR